jgi:hypothetical protein
VSNKIEKLKFYLQNNLNVLLEGKHGVGKTAMIKQVFESAGLVLNESYLYFSASTLDPWTDLIGVPKEIIDSDGNRVLDFVRPRNLSDSSKVQAIFFDEFNRAPKKIRNAVLELIQFKSINGKKFPNLKVVWAAINPYTEEELYDVEKLDPPQRDRFEIFLPIPYECDKDFFIEKYGDRGLAAVEWWNDLPVEMKDAISPRRLDYAVSNFIIGGDLEDVVPRSSNLSKLKNLLVHGPFEKALFDIMNKKDLRKAKTFISQENNYEQAKKYLKTNSLLTEFFLPLIGNEKISMLLGESDSKIIKDVIFSHIKNSKSGVDTKIEITQKYDSILNHIIMASADKSLVREIGNFYDSITKSNILDIDSSKIVDWSQLCLPSADGIVNDDRFNDIVSNPTANNPKDNLAFLHFYINKAFTTRLNQILSSNFVNAYNSNIALLTRDQQTPFISDEIFKTKIRKANLKFDTTTNFIV